MAAVLIVDDNVDIRSFLSDLLGSEGYDVTAVCNGQQALESLRRAVRPCVVLLDLMMPVLDGYAVYRAWNADPGLRGAHRLIIMSAADRLRVGDFPLADALLPKPFDLMDLLDVVEVLAGELPDHPPFGNTELERDAPWAG